MKIKSVGLILFLSLCVQMFAVSAYACSCGGAPTIPDLVEQTPYIFEGRVQKTKPSNTTKYTNQKTTFDIIRSYKGNVSYPAEVFHATDSGGNCGIDFETGQEIFMMAYENDDGKLTTGLCALNFGYFSEQLIEYIERGIDTSVANEYCLLEIQMAYDHQEIFGVFELDDQKCLDAVPYYDQLYRSKG